MFVVAGIDNPKLDSTTSHPSSSSHSHSLPRRVVCHPGHLSCVDDYGWSGSMASVRMLRFNRLLLLLLSVGRQSVSVSATVTAHVSEPSVSAVVSVVAITGLQIRRHFRLRLKPEKVVSVDLYMHCVPKKEATKLWAVTLSNLNRF